MEAADAGGRPEVVLPLAEAPICAPAGNASSAASTQKYPLTLMSPTLTGIRRHLGALDGGTTILVTSYRIWTCHARGRRKSVLMCAATIRVGSASNCCTQAKAVFRSLLEQRICRVIALAMLIAIAAVLISPAVPTAPTLLPVGTLLLLGLILMGSHALMRAQRPLRALLHPAQRTAPGASLEFVSAGLPLRC